MALELYIKGIAPWGSGTEARLPIPERIQDYLDRNHVLYRRVERPLGPTPTRAAQSLVEDRDAKIVVVLVEGMPVITVIPREERLDLSRLIELAEVAQARLATEAEIAELFPDCEPGATPALGELYDVPVWLDASFDEHPTLTFDAGTRVDAVQVATADFRRLTAPRIAVLTESR